MDRRKRYRQTVALMSMLSETKTIDNADIATFDGNGADLLSLIVGIDPLQDLHGYDSPWPAGGGKNKVQVTASSATVNGITFTVNSDGTVTANGTATEEVVFILNDTTLNTGAGTFTGSGATGGSGSTYYLQFRVDGVWRNCYESITYENTETGVTSVLIDIKSGITMNNYVFKPQLEAGSTATAFAPYSNLCPISGWTACNISHSGEDTSEPTTYHINFPFAAGTVYGGTIDVVGKKLTVNRAIVDLGTLEWATAGSGRHNTPLPPGMKAIPNNVVTNSICSEYKAYSGGTIAQNDMSFGVINENVVQINDSRFNGVDASDFKSAMSGVQLCYELATPIVYDLADVPTIQTFAGENNIWADTGKIIFLEYEA